MTRPYYFIPAFLAWCWAVACPAQPDTARILAECERGRSALNDEATLDSAWSIGKLALEQSRRMGFAYGESCALTLIGHYHKAYGEISEAEAAYLQAYAIRRRLRRESEMANSLINIGNLFRGEGKADSAIWYYRQAEKIYQKRRDTIKQGIAQASIAGAWLDHDQPDSALVYGLAARSLLQPSEDFEHRGLADYDVGQAYYDRFYLRDRKADLDTAQTYFLAALANYQKTDNKLAQADCYNALGAISVHLSGQADQGREYLEKSLELMGEHGDPVNRLNAWYNLAELERGANRPSHALRAFQNFRALLDSTRLNNDSFLTEFFLQDGRLYQNYVVKEEGLLNNQARIVRNQWWFYALIAGLIILSVVTYYRMRLHRRAVEASATKERLYQEADQLKDQLHQQEVEQLVQESRIQISSTQLESAEQERRRIARQLHDSVGGLMVASKWNLETLCNQAEKAGSALAEELRKNLALQQKAYDELRNVVLKIETSGPPWWDTLRQLCASLDKVYFSAHGLDESVGGAFGEEAAMIVRELITNALRHANAKRIEAQITRMDSLLSIVVSDDGEGFDAEGPTTGSGLRNLSERVSELKGSISFETGRGAGTTVFVDLPIPKSIGEHEMIGVGN